MAGVEHSSGGWWHEDVYQGDDPVAFIIRRTFTAGTSPSSSKPT